MYEPEACLNFSVIVLSRDTVANLDTIPRGIMMMPQYGEQEVGNTCRKWHFDVVGASMKEGDRRWMH